MAEIKYTITLTERAEKNIDDICSYIEKVISLENAQNFYDDILYEIEKLKFLPFRWRKVPELNDDNIREFIFRNNYRVVYMILENEIVEIQTIFDGRMLLRL